MGYGKRRGKRRLESEGKMIREETLVVHLGVLMSCELCRRDESLGRYARMCWQLKLLAPAIQSVDRSERKNVERMVPTADLPKRGA
ncbi:hypothetical protein CC86DRAFT_48813 [Ophiobolus disseminans]|uniref:Uncharacterized protein n=1 Tax=Ophiobolus disseminans TaxID=1469910 RepID=A0A6A6ZX15_9PLEO|nr:hypothetical protein CC86DRAFT_48813 [Ophiobolus disseminans]